MAPRHDQIGKFSLKQYAISQEKTHRAILRKQLMDRRCQQLKGASPCGTVNLREAESDLDEELDNININDYYFLQPIPTKQRRLLLRRAGVKKIDNAEKMELKRIRLSRESCGCDCQIVCNPETCMCCIAGIKCQVDRQSFPCGCTKEGCQNRYGRIEFNPARVRTHFIQTVMRLDMEQREEERHILRGGKDHGIYEGPPDVSSLSHPLESWAHQPSTSISTMYSGSLNGRDVYGNGEHPIPDDPAGCSSSLFSKSCDAYGSGNSLEENIPVEVHPPRQHDLIPQMLQFNDSEDESTLAQPIAPLCNVPLPTMPCYDSSEDNFSSTSDSSSSSEASSNYELNECGAPFNFKPSADYNLASSLVQSPEVNSLSHSSPGEGSLPHLTPLEVSSVFSTRRQAVDETDSKTYTELKQPNSYASSGFAPSLYNTENSAHSSYGDMFMSYESSKVAESIPLPLPSLPPEPLAYTTCNSPTTSSTYTVMSSLSVVDSLAEMQETAMATSKLSTVTFGGKDDPSTSFIQPEPILFSGSTSANTVADISSSFSVTPSCDDGHGNEATATVAAEDQTMHNQSQANAQDGDIPHFAVGQDVTDSADLERHDVCSSSEIRPVFPSVPFEQSAGDKESTDTCSIESFPGEHSQEDAVNLCCCTTSEAQGTDNVTEDRRSRPETTESADDDQVEAGPCPSAGQEPSAEAGLDASMQNDLVTCSDTCDQESLEASNLSEPISSGIPHLDKLAHSVVNGKVSVLTHLPNEALADSAADLAKKIQVLRGNSEGDSMPSISPDSLSPDGVMSDDPFRQAVDESSFSSSDSAVGHMTGVNFPEISSGLPLVQAGLSE